ncbi:MAG: murein biosynthesis integral membrane protein MurJ [Proteobacteria bacterium]|nr:murein biosynthesis integral membrane protein MurJ [Pseudomonadota bacterium]
MSLIKSISTFSGLTLISRFLGFARDILIAKFLGAGLVSDVFFVAFKLPNFFRRLFAEGAFSAAFVPIFCGLLGSGKDAEKRRLAERFAEESLSVLVSILLAFTVVMQVAMPWVMILLAPGFMEDPAKFDLAIEFSRMTFPYLMLISIVALLGGVLNGLGRFAAGAAAPILMNLTLITAMIFFHDNAILTGHALARAVTLAGIIQLVWMLWGLSRAGFRPKLLWPKLTPRVRELGRVMAPVAFGAGVMQINLIVDVVLSSFLPQGSLSFLYYADRLNQLPIGVIGVAVGTVLLPALSRSLGAGNKKQAIFEQNRAMEAALLLTIPAAFALFIISFEMIAVLFQRGEFVASDTLATSKALMAYVIGLPAYVLVKVLVPAYYSRKDTKTPVKFGLISIGVNFVLNIVLMQFLAHVGLALATAIASWVNVTLLYLYLARRGYFRVDKRLKRRVLKIIGSSLVMGAVLWAVSGLLAPSFARGTFEGGAALIALVLIGLLVYGGAARLTGALSIAEARQLFSGKGPKG